MKPFHFYLFLLFACWLQPQVLPAQDNRLAEHPFSQDSWYRADSMQYFYLHAHKLRPIHRGAGGIYGNFEERMPFKLIYSLKFGEWQDSIYCRKCDIKIADVDSSFVQMELRNLVLKETPCAAVLVEEFWKKAMALPECYILGEIHGKRVMPDSTVLAGKLYDFRLSYKPQANSFDSCYIRPYRPLEKKGQQTD